MPRNLRQLSDFGDTTLGVSKNKHVLRYNNSTGKFDLIPFDTALEKARFLKIEILMILLLINWKNKLKWGKFKTSLMMEVHSRLNSKNNSV